MVDTHYLNERMAWRIWQAFIVVGAVLLAGFGILLFAASAQGQTNTPTRTVTPTVTNTATPSPTACRTWQVNSTADGDDYANDEVCETGDGNGICTLRAAIQEANTHSCASTITFNVSGGGCTDGLCTIAAGTLDGLNNLPTITKAHVKIDGTTQSGASCGTGWWTETYTEPTLKIKLTSRPTLTVGAAGVVVQGLWFDPDAAQEAWELLTVNSSGDYSTIRCNRFERAGKGVVVDAGASGVTLGGAASGDGNIVRDVSGNTIIIGAATESAFDYSNRIEGNEVDAGATGIVAYGQDGAVIDRNWVHDVLPGQGVGNGINLPSSINCLATRNYSGVNRTGTAAAGNHNGIHTSTSENTTCSGHVIGGSADNKNIFSGNATNGVLIDDGCDNITVTHNYIGVGADGVTAICNGTQINDNGTGTTLANNTLCVPTPTIPAQCCQLSDGSQVIGHPGATCIDNVYLSGGGNTVTSIGGCAGILGIVGGEGATVVYDGENGGMNCNPTPGDLDSQCVTATPTVPAGPTNTPTVTPTPRPDTVGRLWFREPCVSPPCDSEPVAWRGRKTVAVDVPVGTASVDVLCVVGHSDPITLATLTGTDCDTAANCQATTTAGCDELYLEVTACAGCAVSGSVRQH